MFLRLVLVTLLGLTWTTVSGLPCAQMFPSQPPPSTVDSVRPSDVAVLSSVGLHMHSTELSSVVSRLTELMSLFNPALIGPQSVQSNTGLYTGSTLVEQAKEITLDLQNSQVHAGIQAQVKEVDDALQLLHSQLKRTIVSVALWDGEHDAFQHNADSESYIPGRMCPCMKTNSEGEVRLLRATLTHALQESLNELMVKKHWYGDRDDFTVTLQDKPFITELSSATSGKSLSVSEATQQTDELMVQMWTNLLQPTVGQENTQDNGQIIMLPCPTEDRPFLRTEGNSPSYHHSHVSPLVPTYTGTEMPCKDLSPSESTPTSVHELRPGDIKVVAAVGDSLTAGNGIASSPSNILDVLRQYRGLSWSIGGDGNLTTVTTVPNILKYFNHNLTGYSVGMGKEHTPQAFFNQAVAGAKSKDLPSQVRALVERMKNNPSINFESDWKLITVFVGGNDICDHCYNSLLFSEENYVRNVRESLDYLHKQVPRALVNLVEPLHITPLREMHMDPSLKCPTWLVKILCPCVVLPKSESKALQMVEDINRSYQRLLHELVETGQYDTRSDFTVVIQPFFKDIVVPRLPDGRPDRSFFSADCFHLSQRAQTQMARSLWNNMLEPLGKKTSKQDFSADIDLKCPTKTSPYIRTYNNSNYIYAGPPETPAPITNWGSDFSCVNLGPSSTVPTSVHKLRPADIMVVAALGDSSTAGTGAKSKNVLELNKEYKGVSWSIGGDDVLEKVTTLPNILRKFNSGLQGFSTGVGSRKKNFNMAARGAKTSDIPAQVQALIKAMREHKNNLSPKNYSHNIKLSLDMLYKEVPRVLVNVVEIMQIYPLRTVKKNTLGCSLLPRTSCPCVINPSENSPELEEIKRVNLEYQAELQHLISGDSYNGKEDFSVVLQPFLHNSFIPHIGKGEPDTSFFSADCFHISERTHAEMAIALWNNMLEPVGRKQAYNNFTYDRSKIHCPSEASPFIFTKVNSLPASPGTTPPTTISTTDTTTFTPVPKCPPSLPVWVPVVVGIVSLLVGITVTWHVLSCTQRRKKSGEETETGVRMKGTHF
ncbi:hypothetical protein INR49_028643 [Caranx melampygus]|nr:hypothetical protein INR49_028643 [Caranx melampygus]